MTTEKLAALNEEQFVLVQSQVKTLRVQIHAAERRLFDIEIAQHLGAARVDVHADELKDIRQELQDMRSSVSGLITSLEGVITP